MSEDQHQYPSHEIVTIEEQTLIFQGLLALIQNGQGVGLHNADPGHPLYTMDYNDETKNDYPFQSHPPEKNTLFGLMKRLSRSMREFGNDDKTWYRRIDNWTDFQRLIQEARIDE